MSEGRRADDPDSGLKGLAGLPPGARLRTYDHVYLTLRRSLVTEAIAPGERLVEVEIAERLQVSRTPVREALRRLESEGLAERRSGSGLVAGSMSVDDLKDIASLRVALDGLAARLACERGKPSDWDHLRDLVETMGEAMRADGLSSASFHEAHLDVHRGIYRIAFSPRLARSLEVQTLVYVEIVAELSYVVAEGTADPVAQHLELVETMASGDIDRAIAQAEIHAQEGAEGALRGRLELDQRPR